MPAKAAAWVKAKPRVTGNFKRDATAGTKFWRGGADLQKADRELLGRAGLEPGNRLILKFLPPAIEAACLPLLRPCPAASTP